MAKGGKIKDIKPKKKELTDEQKKKIRGGAFITKPIMAQPDPTKTTTDEDDDLTQKPGGLPDTKKDDDKTSFM